MRGAPRADQKALRSEQRARAGSIDCARLWWFPCGLMNCRGGPMCPPRGRHIGWPPPGILASAPLRRHIHPRASGARAGVGPYGTPWLKLDNVLAAIGLALREAPLCVCATFCPLMEFAPQARPIWTRRATLVIMFFNGARSLPPTRRD